MFKKIIAVSLLSLLLLSQTAFAVVSPPNFWKRSGNNVSLQSDSWVLAVANIALSGAVTADSVSVGDSGIIFSDNTGDTSITTSTNNQIVLKAGNATMLTLASSGIRVGTPGLLSASTATSMLIKSATIDAVGRDHIILDSTNDILDEDSSLVSIKNKGVTKASFDKDGSFYTNGGIALLNALGLGKGYLTFTPNGAGTQDLIALEGAEADDDSEGVTVGIIAGSAGDATIVGNGYRGGDNAIIGGDGSSANTEGNGGSGGGVRIYGGEGGLGAGAGIAGSNGDVILNVTTEGVAQGRTGIRTEDPDSNFGLTVADGIKTTTSLNLWKGLYSFAGSQAVADDGSVIVDTGMAGFGFVQLGDNEAWAQFTWSADGTVYLMQNTPNVSNLDTDSTLSIYDGGTGIVIKNRLGSEKTIRFQLNYS